MSLLFADSFDLWTASASASFSPANTLWTGGGVSGTGSLYVGTDYGRFGTVGLRCVSSGTNWVASMYKDLGVNRTTLVVGISAYSGTQYSSQNPILKLQDGTSNQLELNINNVGNLIISRNGTVLAASSKQFTPNQYRRIEFKATIDATSGSYELRVDGVVWLSASGVNTKGASSNNVNRLWLGQGGANGYGTMYFDDVMFWDDQGDSPTDFIGDCRIQTKAPTSNGSVNQFAANGAASNYQCVDEIPSDSDTTYVSSANPGDEDRYMHAGDVVGASVIALATVIQTRKDDSNPRSIRTEIKSGATVQDSGSDVILASNYSYWEFFFPTDPNTSSPWSIAAVNAVEFGVKVTA